ncbi:MAG: YbaN family protein [Thermoplasmatales archaeon]|nr:MAG: YbaN family protein [Thermoplasmatales archaeon]
MKRKSKQSGKTSNQLLKWILITAGTIFIGIGIIGIFIPILPTTPFLLLAAACYARSSIRFYNWLMNNKLIGAYIKNYREKRGIPLKIKVFTIFLLWITILFSVFFILLISWIKIILIIIAIGVTIHILTIKTYTQKRQR